MKDSAEGLYMHYTARLDALEDGRGRSERLAADELADKIFQSIAAFSAASQAYMVVDGDIAVITVPYEL